MHQISLSVETIAVSPNPGCVTALMTVETALMRTANAVSHVTTYIHKQSSDLRWAMFILTAREPFLNALQGRNFTFGHGFWVTNGRIRTTVKFAWMHHVWRQQNNWKCLPSFKSCFLTSLCIIFMVSCILFALSIVFIFISVTVWGQNIWVHLLYLTLPLFLLFFTLCQL